MTRSSAQSAVAEKARDASSLLLLLVEIDLIQLFNSQLKMLKSFKIGLEPAAQFP